MICHMLTATAWSARLARDGDTAYLPTASGGTRDRGRAVNGSVVARLHSPRRELS